MVWLTVGPDSMSTVRFTPLPPVASSTCFGHSGSLVLTARSAPNSLSRARRASLVEVPTTNFAPISLAICKPMMPTPELAPWTITVSPALSRPAVTSALCKVFSPIGRVAACSKPMPSGIFMARPQSLTATSAWLPGEWHITLSPFLKSRTRAPTSITSPENSPPIGLPAAAPWLVSPLADRDRRG